VGISERQSDLPRPADSAYAVPSFISILIFKGLFNQSFGEINMMLSALFGIKPAWFSDPTTARSMIIIVNTWLGYPYMMILCMGC
jgi:maltose/maltodextrin transport system permease protein